MNFNHTKTFTDSYMDIFRNHTKGESEWDSILISYFIYIASVTIKMLCKCLAPKQTAVVGNLEQDQAHMPTHASYMQIHSVYRRCTQLAAFPNEKVPESIKFHSRVLEAKAMRKSSPVYTAEAVTWPHTGRLLDHCEGCFRGKATYSTLSTPSVGMFYPKDFLLRTKFDMDHPFIY